LSPEVFFFPCPVHSPASISTDLTGNYSADGEPALLKEEWHYRPFFISPADPPLHSHYSNFIAHIFAR
jgi:hypothetical protein